MTFQKPELLRVKIMMALYDTLGRWSTDEEIEEYTITAQVLCKVVAGTKAMHSEVKQFSY